MSVRRAAALTALLCAIAMGSLALPWFRADLHGREVVFGASSSSPVVWVIAPLGPAIVFWVLRAARRGALTGQVAWRSLTFAVAAAVVGCAVAIAVTLWPSIAVGPVGVTRAPQIPVGRLPAGFVAAGAFAGIASLLCSWMIGVANAIEDGDRTRRD